jgi:putative cardiolipin synthase
VQSIIRTNLDRDGLRRHFDSLVDEGEQMMSLTLPAIDILGYGPISEDLEAGRLGLIWGKAMRSRIHRRRQPLSPTKWRAR